MTTVQDLINWLQRNYKPDTPVAYTVWTIDDVLQQAEDDHVQISEEEAADILENVHIGQSADSGINWSEISFQISEYLSEKGE